MTAELVRGQNHPLSQTRLEIRVSAGEPVVAGAVLGDRSGRAGGAEDVAHPGAPTLPGLEVPRRAAADHRLAVDLSAVPDAVHRVSILLALPPGIGGPVRFGAVAAPALAVTGADGTGVARYTITGLDAESAVVALELYRRQGAWKVRAVGQGYAGGLAELLTDQGLATAAQLAREIDEAVTRGMPRSPAAPPQRTGDTGRARQTALPAAGADQGGATHGSTRGGSGERHEGGTASRPGPPYGDTTAHTGPSAGPPYDGPPAGPESPAGTAAADRGRRPGTGTPQSAAVPAEEPAPAGAGTAASRTASGTASGGPVDYRHPRRRSAPPPPAQPGRPAPPVAGDASGWSMDERLYNQVWGMFEDLARTTASYRGAVDFADSRMEKELGQALSDPRARLDGRGDAARQAAQGRRDQLVEQARQALDRDLAQLTAESDVVEPALPAAYARWDNPVWHGYRVPMEMPMAMRLGDLHLPECAGLRIPMLVRLPLERGLWIDSGRSGSAEGAATDSHELRRLSMDTAVAHAARLLAVHPAGEFTVHVIDPAGAGVAALDPLVRCGVLAGPPAQGAAGVADVLARLTQRVDLVQMAVRGGASEALPPGFDASHHLVIVNDFPHGFDDRAVNQLRYLADEGPAVGVHLMLVADREDAAGYGPLLDPLWRSLLRLTPVPDDHLADPWVGHCWTYEPALVPAGSQVVRQVLTQVAETRRTWNR